MTFSWLNLQGVRSSEGFTLQRMHRYFYHYLSGERTIEIVVEPCQTSDNEYLEYIDTDSIDRWREANPAAALTDGESTAIIANTSAALTFMGIRHEIRSFSRRMAESPPPPLGKVVLNPNPRSD